MRIFEVVPFFEFRFKLVFVFLSVFAFVCLFRQINGSCKRMYPSTYQWKVYTCLLINRRFSDKARVAIYTNCTLLLFSASKRITQKTQ